MRTTRHIAKQRERGHDYKFWSDFPEMSQFPDANIGLFQDEDFIRPPDMASATNNGGWLSYQDTGNTILPLDTYPGGIWALTTDGTDEDEVWLQSGGATGGQFYFSSTTGHSHDQWWETVVDVDRITANAVAYFWGLAEKASAVANHLVDATGALQTARAVVGFHSLVAAPQTMRAVYNTASGTVASLGTAATLVVGTFTRFGIRYRRSNNKVEYWVNGTKMWDVAIDTANFPDGVNLTPMWGFKSTTATATNLYLDRSTYGLLW